MAKKTTDTQAKQIKDQKKSAIKGNSKAIKKDEKAKWDLKKVKKGDFFSCLQYMRVDKINKDTVELINQHGESLAINKNILEKDSFSADHFK